MKKSKEGINMLVGRKYERIEIEVETVQKLRYSENPRLYRKLYQRKYRKIQKVRRNENV